MRGPLETFRSGESEATDSLYWIPINQKLTKDIRGLQKKGYNRNAEKSNERKEKERLRREALQLQKAVDHVLGGHDDLDTPQAWDALLTVSRNEVVREIFTTEKGTVVTKATIDLTSKNVSSREDVSGRVNPINQERLAS